MNRYTLLSLLLTCFSGSSQAFVVVQPPTATTTALPRRSMTTRPTSSSTTTTSLNALEAILWDMDGVLADTERDAHRPAFNQAFQELGLETEWSVERYGKLLEVGGGKERMTAHWTEVGWPESFPEDDEGRQEQVKALHLRKTDIFNEMIQAANVPLRPGVLRVVDEAIAKGLQLAVCSTSNEKAVRNLVQTLMGPERAQYFSIFAGDMVKRKKPAPDVYLMAVEQMGLDKSKTVIVEDSHIGLGAALAAGIPCIVTKSSYTANEDFTGASMIVDELGDDPATGVTLDTLESLLPSKEEDISAEQLIAMEDEEEEEVVDSGVLDEQYMAPAPPPVTAAWEASATAPETSTSSPAVATATTDIQETPAGGLARPSAEAEPTEIAKAVPSPAEMAKTNRKKRKSQWVSFVFWKDANLYNHVIG